MTDIFLPYRSLDGGSNPVVTKEYTCSAAIAKGMPVKISEATLGSVTVAVCAGDTTPEVVVGIAMNATTASGQKVIVALATATAEFAALPDDTYTGYEFNTAYGLKVTTCKPDSADTTGGMFNITGFCTVDGATRLLGTFVPTYRAYP